MAIGVRWLVALLVSLLACRGKPPDTASRTPAERPGASPRSPTADSSQTAETARPSRESLCPCKDIVAIKLSYSRVQIGGPEIEASMESCGDPITREEGAIAQDELGKRLQAGRISFVEVEDRKEFVASVRRRTRTEQARLCDVKLEKRVYISIDPVPGPQRTPESASSPFRPTRR